MGCVLPDSKHRHRLLQGGRGRAIIGRRSYSRRSDVYPLSGVGPCDCLRVLPPDHGAIDRGLPLEEYLGGLSGEQV